jgi:ankyrin repeat protein
LNYQTCVDESTALNTTPVNYTLLMEACRRGHLEITMKLLDVEGIDVNMRDSHGRSANLMEGY